MKFISSPTELLQSEGKESKLSSSPFAIAWGSEGREEENLL